MVDDIFRKKQVPWCTIFLISGAMICHVLVLVGNCSTASAMDSLGASTGGWAKVGKGVARSLRIELDHHMHQVSSTLVDGIGHLGVVSGMLETILELAGNYTGVTSEESNDLWSTSNEVMLSMLQQRQDQMEPEQQQRRQQQQQHGKKQQQQHQQQQLRQHHQEIGPSIVEGLVLVIGESVHKALTTLMGKVSSVLHQFLETIRPALEQIGDWLVRFGDKVQAGINLFSITLDRVQKLFDQVMSNLAGQGENSQVMLDTTFGLFDVSNTGYVTVEDLKGVADLYRITTLQGNIPQDLADKYDSSGDGKLSKEEIALLVNDEALPNLMSGVLRIYAKRLAEIGGVVAAARHRDEVAEAVVDYIALVCSKNATKVRWVSDSLGNGSLPMSFTADVMAELCLSEDAPDRLTTASIGATLVEAIYDLHPDYTLQALDLMSNASFWVSEGFHVDDQPGCVKRITSWITTVSRLHAKSSGESAAAAAVGAMGKEAILDVLSGAHNEPVDSGLLAAIPGRMADLAKEDVTAYLQQRRREHQRQFEKLHYAWTPDFDIADLTSGMHIRSDGAPSAGERAVRSGQPAAPETLEFAQWLASNATQNAAMMHDMCFVYSSESSAALDSFGAQIQMMVSQVQAFLDSMIKYATPAGIKRLEQQIEDFERNALGEMMRQVEQRLFSLMNTSLPQLELTIKEAVHHVGEWLVHKLNRIIEDPLSSMLQKPLDAYATKLETNPVFGKIVSTMLGPDLAHGVLNLTSDALADALGQFLENFVDKALEKGVDIGNATISRAVDGLLRGFDNLIPSHAAQKSGHLDETLLQVSSMLTDEMESRRGAFMQLTSNTSWHPAQRRRSQRALQLGSESSVRASSSVLGAMKSKYSYEFEVDGPREQWEAMVQTVQILAQVLPASIHIVKSARVQVSKLYSNLDTIFSVFDERGKQLFDTVARFWRTLWILYFCSLIPLNFYMLYYGFWAGGFFGGPSPLPPEEGQRADPPRTLRERLALCWESCSLCMKKYHDTQLCFWSAIMLLQVVVLAIFVISIALCTLTGIKAFITAGCTPIYVLGDEAVCTEQLANIRDFLSTFFIMEAMEPLYGACGNQRLLTCNLIKQKMVLSGIFVATFSFLGTLFSLELIVDSAVIHEQARWRRLYASVVQDEKEIFTEEDAGALEAPRSGSQEEALPGGQEAAPPAAAPQP